ncbi:ABC transporter permease [Nocardiopsis aegyptia]|uniref:ABC transporter permease n=1 Tax=Nocardiopsis aegyptia TaxID=220378 RepID=UPI00366C49B5
MTASTSPTSPTPTAASRGSRPPGPARAASDLAAALSSEWVKLRSVRSTWWGLAAALLLMGTVAPFAALSLASNMANGDLPSADIPASEMALYATVWAVQFAIIAVALPSVTAEYSSGSVRPSLQAVPTRLRLLVAKAAALAMTVFVAGLLLAGVGTLATVLVAGHPFFGGHVVFDAGAAVADALRAAAYLAAVSVLTLGVGAALRSAAAALTCVFMLLMGLPVMLMLLGSELGLYLACRMPFFAGISFADSPFVLGELDQALSPAAGGVVLACWAVAAFAAGATVLVRRDA